MNRIFIVLAAILLLSACNSGGGTVIKVNEPLSTVEKKMDEERVDQEEKDVQTSEEEHETDELEKVDAEYRMNENTYALEPILDANPKVILLTIDDAPDKYALEMAKTLKNLNAPAIFFVNGHFIDTPEEEEILKQIYDLGFTIGNHTYSHENLSMLTPEKQRKEIISVNDKVEEITGERPKFFRAPFGVNTDESRKIAAEENMLLMNWTYGYDWEKQYMSKDAITDIMVNTELLRDGSNLLMHDREWTNEGLEKMVIGLREKGYEPLNPDLIDSNE